MIGRMRLGYTALVVLALGVAPTMAQDSSAVPPPPAWAYGAGLPEGLETKAWGPCKGLGPPTNPASLAHSTKLYRRGATLLEKDDPRGVPLLQAAIEQFPQHVAAYYKLVIYFLHKRGDSGRAIEIAERAAERVPACAEVHGALLGPAYAVASRWKEAESAYRRAAALDPENASWHFNLGNQLLRQRRLLEAIAAYAKALALDSDHGRARKNLIIASLEAGDIDTALKWTDGIEMELEVIQQYARKGHAVEALLLVNRVLQRSPGNARAHLLRAATFATLKRYAESAASAKQALVLDPQNQDARRLLRYLDARAR